MSQTMFERFDELAAAPIAGRYQLIRPIARGSMGAVFEAEQVPLGRKVALKILDPRADLVLPDEASEGGGSLGPTDRFIREAASAARLAHPNIAVVYDYGEWHHPVSQEVMHYIAMEYVPGKALSELVCRGETLPLEQALDLVCQVLDALDAAHAQGIVHRDLKPSNVLVTDDHRVKVVDFGLAKRLDDSMELETQAGLILGTPAYMAPEQLLGAEPTPQTDIYAATCLLVRVLTGHTVYKGSTSVATMSMHITEDIPSFSEFPPVLRRILRQGLAKKPKERFASAKEFHDALVSFALDDDEPRAVARAPRRLALVAGGAVLVLLLLLIGGAVLFASTLGQGDAPESLAADPVATPAPPDEPTTVEVEAAAPETRKVTLQSTPSGAAVFDGDEVLCTTPCDLEFVGTRDLVLRAVGYEDLPYAVTRDGTHAVTPTTRSTRAR